MKKYLPVFYYFIFSIFLLSCEEENALYIEKNDHLFIGYWEASGYSDTTEIFERRNDLAKNNYSFGILYDGTFIENKNSGFCSTPPIHYSEYEGTWLGYAEDTLLINTSFWGGDLLFYMVIQSVNEKELQVKMDFIEIVQSDSNPELEN